jgi:hypothetical protein
VIDNREEPSAPVHVRIAAMKPTQKTEPLRLDDLPGNPYPPGVRPRPQSEPPPRPAQQVPATPEPIALANVTAVSPSRVAPVPKWLWLLLLVPFLAAGVVAALYWRSKKLKALSTIGEPSASAESSAHPLPEIPAPAHPRDGRTLACEGADKQTWASLRAKLPEAAKAGAGTTPQANVEIGQAGDATLRLYDTRGKKRTDRIAKAGADLGYLALSGTKKAILVDAPADKREAIRAAACD